MINITIKCGVLWSIVLGCETLSVILRDTHRLPVYESVVLWKIFALKEEKKQETVESCIVRNLLI
jgi:hypothetical protein